MRVGILGLLQESNTFLPEKTTWAHFEADVLAFGEEIRDRFIAASHELGGFFAGLEEAGLEAVPIMAARALPYGLIAKDDFARLCSEMLSRLRGAGQLDGILFAAHGATVSEAYHDADGYLLQQVRRELGSKAPLIATIDPHANLSTQMVAACDALIAYRTNPHIDQRERGIEAAQLMAKVLAGDVKPTVSARYPPLAISIECQCTEESPCRDVVDSVAEARAETGVLSTSLILGFPYADVPEMGSAVVVTTDNDQPLADALAEQLGQQLWIRRQAFVCRLPTVDEAVRRIAELPAPICLLDTGDNVGGGSPGDGAWIAHALRAQNIDRAFVCLFDPQGAAEAFRAGKGATISLAIGGKGKRSGQPLVGDFQVVSLHDGKFSETEPRHGGFSTFDQGPTAVMQCGGLTVMATSRRMAPFSLAQLTSCHIEPTQFRVLAAKGVNAPIAAYRDVCQSFIRVGTPGVTAADMTTLEYHRRRIPLFPFEQT